MEPPPLKGMEPPPSKGMEPPLSKGMEPPPLKGMEPPPSKGMEPPPSKGMEPPPSKGTLPCLPVEMDPMDTDRAKSVEMDGAVFLDRDRAGVFWNGTKSFLGKGKSTVLGK